jgi:transglutaminase-like putative cysteine protease
MAAMHLSTLQALLEYEVKAPTHFCLQLEAAHWPTQAILSETLELPRRVSPHRFEDLRFGNRFVRFDAEPGRFVVSYTAEVRLLAPPPAAELVENPVAQIPDAIFEYLLPSRYCESDVLLKAAHDLFGDARPGVSRVHEVVQWIREHVEYKTGSTVATTTALDVFEQRAGVCRDFAHLGITFCRALSIPARMVAGYVWFDDPPQDFHAVFEAWIGGQWVLFDPTGMAPVDRLVRVGTGRDAKDVAFCTYFGETELKRKEIVVLEHDPRVNAGVHVVHHQPTQPTALVS